MDEEKKRVIEDPLLVEKEPESLRSQVGALVVLLLVAGAIWLLFQSLPILGDWLGEKADQVVATAPEAGDKVEASSPEPDSEAIDVLVEEVSTVPVSGGELDSFRRQLTEQLGGDSIVVVRHLALSEDNKRMVAAIAWKDGREPTLIEIFFERDEFGRYLSSDDAPVETQIKLWGS